MDVKTKYTLSIDHLIARIDWYDEPALPDIIETLQAVLDDPRYHKELLLLVVDHGLYLDWKDQDVAAFVEALTPAIRKFRCSALAVASDHNYDVARLFSAYLLKQGILSGAFKDDVAGVWLLGNGDAR